MANIITRALKGSRLTHQEMDSNFNLLNSSKIEAIPVASPTTLGGVKQGSNVSIDIDGTLTAVLPESGYLTPQAFGAVGNGIADDTKALNDWAAAMATRNKNGFVPPGTYRVTQAGYGVKFINLNGRSINFGNAVFRVLDDNLVGGGQAGFYFENCVDCDFYGFNYDGNRIKRIPTDVFSHNVVIMGGNKSLRFWASSSDNSVSDGWYISPTDGSLQASYPTDIHLIDCTADNSFKSNLNLVGSIRFKDVRGRYTGATGVAPECGVNVYPTSSSSYGNIAPQFLHTTVSSNHGWGMKWDGDHDNINGVITGLSGSMNVQGLLNINRVSILEVNHLRAGDHATAPRGIVEIGQGATNVSLRHPAFNNVSANQTLSVCVYVHPQAISTGVYDLETVNCACATLAVWGDAVVNGVRVNGSSCSSINIANYKADNDFSDLHIKGLSSERAFYSSAANTVIKDITIIDCAFNGGLIYLDTGANGSTIRGAKFVQSGGVVPAGQFGILSNVALSEISNVKGGTGYTSANIISLSKVNATDTVMSNITPDPMKQIVAHGAVDITAGQVVYMGTVNFPMANYGDRVAVTSEQALGGVLFYGSVWTNGGDVAWYAVNNNATTVNVLAGNFRIRVLKD